MYSIYMVENKRNAIGLGQKGSCLTIIAQFSNNEGTEHFV